MIAETIAEAYDAEGKKVLRPFDHRRSLKPTFPLGRYVSHPLTIHCHSIHEVRSFLLGCQYVPDEELFGKRDYWQPPEEFETRKKGDCEDFAFWTWRQLMEMGYDTRVVFGQHGRYGAGHAWIEFFKDNKCFLLEPLARRIGEKLPRLSTLSYHPKFSVAWDGQKLSYFAHQDRPAQLSFSEIGRLLPEYLWIWGGLWICALPRMPFLLWSLLKRFAKGFRWSQRNNRGQL